MKKFSIAFLLVGLLFSILGMRGATTEFTYAQGELFGYGQGLKENIDVAMCIDNYALRGMKITNIKAYLSGTEGYENTSIWLSGALNLENKVNVPDIATFDVTPQTVEYGAGTLGMLSLDLVEPYELTGQPLYIGYSLTVVDNTEPEQKFPIVVSEGSQTNGFFLHMSKSVLKWMDYNVKAKGVAYIVVTLEGEIKEHSLSVMDYEEANVMVDTDFSVEFLVNNSGSKDVSEVKYTYTYDDEDIVREGAMTLPAPIKPDVTITLPVTLDFEKISSIGPHLLHLAITEVDGYPNVSELSSIDCLVNVMPYAPVHRPLVEEFTGLWCGWCPRGWLGMDMLGENYGENVVVLCYHNGDGMAVTNTYPVDFSGYPKAAINRTEIVDPYYGTYDESYDFGIFYDVEKSMAEITFADIYVDAEIKDNEVKVTSTTLFMKDIDNADYEIGYVLTCNRLSNLYWVQTNYYSGLKEEYVGTYLEPITEMPRDIIGMVFNDVVVDVSAMSGIEGSIPSSIKTAEEYSNTYTFNIEGNELIQNTQNLIVAAFVIDKKTGGILNSNKYSFYDPARVEELATASEVISTEYYDLSGRKVSSSYNGIVIKRQKLSNGKEVTSKVVNLK